MTEVQTKQVPHNSNGVLATALKPGVIVLIDGPIASAIDPEGKFRDLPSYRGFAILSGLTEATPELCKPKKVLKSKHIARVDKHIISVLIPDPSGSNSTPWSVSVLALYVTGVADSTGLFLQLLNEEEEDAQEEDDSKVADRAVYLSYDEIVTTISGLSYAEAEAWVVAQRHVDLGALEAGLSRNPRVDLDQRKQLFILAGSK